MSYATVRLGRDVIRNQRPAIIAHHFAPYAALATMAYSPLGDGLDRPYILIQTTPLAQNWLNQWRFLEEINDQDTGLGYMLWVRDDKSEAAIAFRGTDAWINNPDARSNLRWFIPKFMRHDQYDVVKRDIKTIVDRLNSEITDKGRIITIGHSLGGGLAQYAGYCDQRIAHVYAFDTSPVTGYYSEKWRNKLAGVGLSIDRIYERHEILAAIRFICSLFVIPTTQNPRIRTVRFDFKYDTMEKTIKNKVVSFSWWFAFRIADSFRRHDIIPLTRNIIEASKNKAPEK